MINVVNLTWIHISFISVAFCYDFIFKFRHFSYYFLNISVQKLYRTLTETLFDEIHSSEKLQISQNLQRIFKYWITISKNVIILTGTYNIYIYIILIPNIREKHKILYQI